MTQGDYSSGNSRPVASLAIARLYPPYVLAATVMVGMLAASYYFQHDGVVPPTTPIVERRTVRNTRDELRLPRIARVEAVLERFVPVPLDILPLAPAVPLAVAVPPPVQAVAAEALAQISEPPVIVIDGPLLEKIEMGLATELAE